MRELQFGLCMLAAALLGSGSAYAQWASDDQRRNIAELFLKYDYSETKDWAKHFLTLISGILVFSLAFSEKIVDFHRAPLGMRRLMVFFWAQLIVSIVLCGLSVCFISLAGGSAVYGLPDFLGQAQTAWVLLLGAGAVFVSGLITLVVAGTLAAHSSTSQVAAKPDQGPSIGKPAVPDPALATSTAPHRE